MLALVRQAAAQVSSRRGWLSFHVATCAAAAAVAFVGLRAISRRRTKQIKVVALFIYPVKGCRGHAVNSAELTNWGLKNDRLYMIVNAKAAFVTQREIPRMATILPDVPSEAGITLRLSPECPQQASVEALFVPLIDEKDTAPQQVQVWDDKVLAVDQGDRAACWLCTVLGQEGLRLMKIARSMHRKTDAKFGEGETGFADGFPILVTSQASLMDVCRHAEGVEIGISRFRPNVHINGCAAFEEDEMRSISFAGSTGLASARLRLVKPCARCTVPNVDQKIGQRTPGGQPIKALRSYRTGKLLQKTAKLHKSHFEDPENLTEAFFGQNAHLEFFPGVRLEVGDVGEVEW